jgi:hypothetical protein
LKRGFLEVTINEKRWFGFDDRHGRMIIPCHCELIRTDCLAMTIMLADKPYWEGLWIPELKRL